MVDNDGSQARIRRRLRRWRFRRQRRRLRRDWAGLPLEIISLIFGKLPAMEVLWPAQAVCRQWRRASFDPHAWRRIDMMNHYSRFMINHFYKEKLAMVAVERSGGQLEEFHAACFGSDLLLQCIADRSAGLKCLVLMSASLVTPEGLLELITRCPLLEELQISNCPDLAKQVGTIGHARPELKRFSLNKHNYKLNWWCSENKSDGNDEAFAIANNMHELRKLQLIGSKMTNVGLMAILDNCRLLESLDLRKCFNLTLDASMLQRLVSIGKRWLPHDSSDDYEVETGNHGDAFRFIFYDGYCSGGGTYYNGFRTGDYSSGDDTDYNVFRTGHYSSGGDTYFNGFRTGDYSSGGEFYFEICANEPSKSLTSMIV